MVARVTSEGRVGIMSSHFSSNKISGWQRREMVGGCDVTMQPEPIHTLDEDL